jgi:nucleoside-diphosphate-sugar epimerase
VTLTRILITGGAGFIGTHLAERLCEKSAVVLFDNGRRDSLSLAPHLRSNANVKFVAGDTLDAASVEGALDGAETVIHLAAIAGVSSYYDESLKTLQVNVLGTVNVLEAAAKKRVKHFIQFSTSEVFGPDALAVDEEHACGIGPSSDRRWVYATSKLAGEHLCLRYGEKCGFAATVVRPFNIYGPRQLGEGAISNFCRASVEESALTIYGDGTALRAWCYVSDLVDAVEAILAHRDATAGRVLNIGNPREVETTLGLVRRFQRLAPGTKVEFRKLERAEVRARTPVIERARQLLGFEPKVELDEGLNNTLRWYRRQKWEMAV